MTTVGGASVDIRPDLSGFGPRLTAGVMGPLRGVERQATKGLSSAFRTAGAFAGVALGGAVLAGSVNSILSVGMNYERTMSLFRSVTAATEAQMAKAATTAQALGSDLNLPGISAAGAAEAMTELAKAGLSTEQAIAATRGALALSIAGQTSAAQAAEITANALLMFGLNAKDSVKVTDLLAGAANASTSSMREMAFALQMGGTAAAGVGIPINDTVTALTMLANAGIRGSDAGTLLKTAIARMSAPTAKAAGEMKRLGLDFFDAKGNFVGMRSTVDQLQKRLGPLSKEQRQVALSTLFGADAARFANIAISEGATKWDKYSTQVNKQGQAAALAKAQNAGLGGALDNLQSTAEGVGLTLYQKVSPALQGVVKGLTSAVSGAPAFASGIGSAIGSVYDLLVKRDFTTAFRNAFGVEEDSPVVAALLFIRDRIAGVIDNLVKTIDPLKTAFANLGRLLAPFVPIVLAVAAVIGGALLYGIEALSGILPPVVSALASFIGFLADNVNTIMALAGGIGAFVAVLKVQAAITWAVAAAQKAFAFGMALVKGAVWSAQIAVWLFNAALAANPIGIVVAAIIGLAVGLFILYKRSEKFRKIVDAVWGAIKTAISAVADWITGTAVPAITGAWDWVVEGVKGMWQAVVGAWNGVKDAISSAWNSVTTFLSDGIAWLVGWGTRILNALTYPTRLALAVMIGVFFAISNAIIGPLQTAWTWLVNMWNSVVAYLTTVLTTLWTRVSTGFMNIYNTVVQWLTTARNYIMTIWNSVSTYIGGIATTIWGHISTAFINIYNAVAGALSRAWAYITSIWNQIVAFIGPIVETIWTRISTGFTRIVTTVSTAVTDLIDRVKRGFQRIVDAITGAVGDATGAATDVGQGILDSITGFVSDLAGAGVDLVWGLINGIVGMGKTLYNAVIAFVKDNVPGPILKILGISSPSKVTTKMGQQTGQGFVNGIESMAKALNRVVTGMVGQVTDGFSNINAGASLDLAGVQSVAAQRIRAVNAANAATVATLPHAEASRTSTTDARIVINGDVRAADVGDFEHQMFQRRRFAALAGRLPN